ncbi:PLD nuclease N-terminal domain-containing protein [Agromyces bauzanensis]
MVRWLFVLGVVAVVFTIYAIADCAFFDRTRTRGLSRGWWIVVILLVPIIGGVLWFVIGRGRVDRSARGSRTIAPDDDTEFLRSLRDDAAQNERIRRMEQELADLDADEPGPAGTDADGAARHDERKRRPDAPDAPGETGPAGRPNG